MVTDHEYPQQAARTLLAKLVEEFVTDCCGGKDIATATQIPFPKLQEYLVKYQDPHEADSMLKIKKELDDTKIILHNTINSMLERGTKLDELVSKSDGLSAQSKMFYTQAKKQNSCCSVM